MPVLLRLAELGMGVPWASRHEFEQQFVQRALAAVDNGAGHRAGVAAPLADMTPEPHDDPRVVEEGGFT